MAITRQRVREQWAEASLGNRLARVAELAGAVALVGVATYEIVSGNRVVEQVPPEIIELGGVMLGLHAIYRADAQDSEQIS